MNEKHANFLKTFCRRKICGSCLYKTEDGKCIIKEMKIHLDDELYSKAGKMKVLFVQPMPEMMSYVMRFGINTGKDVQLPAGAMYNGQQIVDFDKLDWMITEDENGKRTAINLNKLVQEKKAGGAFNILRWIPLKDVYLLAVQID